MAAAPISLYFRLEEGKSADLEVIEVFDVIAPATQTELKLVPQKQKKKRDPKSSGGGKK